MKILLIILIVIVVLVLAMYLWGKSLPLGHSASLSHTFKAPVDTIWNLVADRTTYSKWRGVKLEILNDTTWKEVIMGNMVLMEELERVENEKLVTLISKENKNMGFGGSWTFEVKPDGDGTRLTITENGEVYNPIFRFLSKNVFGHTATQKQFYKQMDKYLSQNKWAKHTL